jgi:hypothetical protein
MRPTKEERAHFKEQCKIEQRLKRLAEEIKAVDGSDPHFCANRIWYDRFKPLVCLLAGFDAENPELRTMKDYDAAYQTLYSMLPDCRDCLCL